MGNGVLALGLAGQDLPLDDVFEQLWGMFELTTRTSGGFMQ